MNSKVAQGLQPVPPKFKQKKLWLPSFHKWCITELQNCNRPSCVGDVLWCKILPSIQQLPNYLLENMFSYSSLSIGYLGHAMKCCHEIDHIELRLVLPTHIQQVLCRRTHAQTPIQLGIFRILTYSSNRFRKERVGTTVEGLRYDLQNQLTAPVSVIFTCFRGIHEMVWNQATALPSFSVSVRESLPAKRYACSKLVPNRHEIHIRMES